MLLVATDPVQPIPTPSRQNYSPKIKLGKKLFFDPILSRDGTVACASCHDLWHGGDDGRKVSIGIDDRHGLINAPTVYNAKYNFRQFWDGSARDLAEQAKGPIENPVEMGNTLSNAVNTLKSKREYVRRFREVYPDGITAENIADAIAEFEKILITPDAPFDKYLRGDKKAISPKAQKGYRLFQEKGCVLCHNGINIGGNSYNRFGIFADTNSTNTGRYSVTKRTEDKYVFKVPSLRNIALTAPYMHDGRAKTLKEAVEIMSRYQLGRYMQPGDIDAIVAFLRTLNGVIPDINKIGQ